MGRTVPRPQRHGQCGYDDQATPKGHATGQSGEADILTKPKCDAAKRHAHRGQHTFQCRMGHDCEHHNDHGRP